MNSITQKELTAKAYYYVDALPDLFAGKNWPLPIDEVRALIRAQASLVFEIGYAEGQDDHQRIQGQN